jgi:hypothetical protein
MDLDNAAQATQGHFGRSYTYEYDAAERFLGLRTAQPAQLVAQGEAQ